jgi:small subunit ribosomal protein S11
MNQKKSEQMNKTGIIHVLTTLSNTIVTLTNLKGDTLSWASGGSQGFKGSKRSTSYAAQMTGETIGKECISRGIFFVHVKFKGIGYGKEASLRGLQSTGLNILKLEDTTMIPFNGCRPVKKRRV